MKAALDVHYGRQRAVVSCVVFETWLDSEPSEIIRVVVPPASQYRAGRFYERELPCLFSLLSRTQPQFRPLVIDGFVHLKAGVGKGLGTHLFESLPYTAEVIGVAKNPLKVADRFVIINRGRSKKPLYISAVGCPVEQAAESIMSMHGPYRIPTLLKLADQYARCG